MSETTVEPTVRQAREAVLDPVAEVRDLVAAGASGGHDRRGRRRRSRWTGRRSCGSARSPRRARWRRWPRPSRAWPAVSATTSWRRRRPRSRGCPRRCKEMAVTADAGRGKRAVGAEWPGPAPGRRGHQGRRCWTCSTTRSTPAGRCAAPATSWSSARSARTAGSPAARRGQLADRSPGGSPMHGLLDRGSGRDPGPVRRVGRDRPLAPQARPPRLLPAPGVGVAVERAAGSFPWPTSTSGRCPGRDARSASPFPDWVEYTPERDLDLRHDALHQGGDGGADHRGPGLAQVDHRGRLASRRPPPRSSSGSPTHSTPRDCWRPSTPATTTAWSTSAPTTRTGRSCSPCPTTARR